MTMATVGALTGIVAGVATILGVAWAALVGNRSLRDLRADFKSKRTGSRHNKEDGAEGSSRPNFVTNLPITPKLFGREQEIADITTLLLKGDSPAILIKGPAGIGKSALAFEVAHRIKDMCVKKGEAERPFDAIYQISAKASQITTGSLANDLGRFLGSPSVSSEPTDEQKVEHIYKLLTNLR